MQVKKQQLEPDMEQWTSSKLGKACIKDVYCHLDYLTSMQSGNESVSRTVMSDSLQPMNCSLPGSSIHGILQARIIEWVAISFSRGSSRPRDQTHIFCISCLADRFFTTESPGKPSLDTHIDDFSFPLKF